MVIYIIPSTITRQHHKVMLTTGIPGFMPLLQKIVTPLDTTKNGWLPGQTYTVNLNKGESYHVLEKPF